MLTLIAALSLAQSLAVTTIDVPYLPQTDVLCGGAAAAMVFRYWGDAHAGIEEFAQLVDRHAGGIAQATLIDAVQRKGWTVDQFTGSLSRLDTHLAAGEPVIVLLADRGSRYHYLVVVGHAPGSVVVHDPSWGPSRRIAESDFEMRWERSNFWSVVIRPGNQRNRVNAEANTSSRPEWAEPPAPPRLVPTGPKEPVDDLHRCDVLLRDAISEATEHDLETADRALTAVRRACPDSAGPVREIAGVRFAQRRWREAADLARQSLRRAPRDEYALDVLGSSLFMLNDEAGALRAWNQIHRPLLDRVRIEGLHHSRYQAIADALRLTPGSLLTAEDFARARRRIADLPDRVTARLDVRPDSDGFATVDVVIAERSAIPDGPAAWSGLAAAAAVDRAVSATLPGFASQGEVWTADWGYWTNRPRVGLGFAAPRVAGFPGIWRLDASWETQTYAFADSSALVRESRTHAGVSITDWLSASWRYTLSTGVDRWSSGRRAASIGGSLERRLADDRLVVTARGEAWLGHGSVPGFNSTLVRTDWGSSPVVAGWSYVAAAGWQRVSENAPLGLWPGADDGHGRDELLRAHPLLSNGIIAATDRSVFGRTLTFGNAEAQRWFATRWPARFGVAAFADVAQAARSAPGVAGRIQFDVGAGARVRAPGLHQVLRIDLAHGLRDGANALSVGWVVF